MTTGLPSPLQNNISDPKRIPHLLPKRIAAGCLPKAQGSQQRGLL